MTDETLFLNKLSEIIHVPVAKLSDATELDPPAWESIEVLDIIVAIDESFGTTIPVLKLTACRSLGELRQLVRSAAS
jgi:acyl carrier protein